MTTRQARKRAQTRARLLAAAHYLMSEKGVDDTAIQEITDKADVGFGTFYNYFSSKDEVAAQVLDCVIHNLGVRNRLANEHAAVADPVEIIINSVRLTAREMRANPMWRWWLKRTDLMVTRMYLGFRPFGTADIARALDVGALSLPADDVDGAWRFLIWLLAGAITDIVEHGKPIDHEGPMAEAIMRVMGVRPEIALAIAARRLPELPDLPIDFDFKLDAEKPHAGKG